MKEVFTLGSRRYQSFGNFGFLRVFFANSYPWASRKYCFCMTVNDFYSKICFIICNSQAEKIIAEEQAGFRAGRSTTEQIFNLRILCEEYLQHQQNLYHVFIDFKKFVLFVLRLNVPVNNFSVMSGRSHRFLGN